MRPRVRTFLEAVEVLQDLVFAADRIAVVGDQDRDLVRTDPLLHLVALVRLGGDLSRREVPAELREPLPHLVRMGTPFRLIELHANSVPRAAVDETGLNP